MIAQIGWKKAIIIGVTGGFGTGKTAVSGIFGKLGCLVLDADKMAHDTFLKNTAPYRKILKLFGRQILDKDGNIDRAKVARLAFGRRDLLKKLCDIVHPVVINRIRKTIKDIPSSGGVTAVAIDAPLLIESGLHKITDCLVVVKTTRKTQIARVMKKTGIDKREVVARIKRQMPLSKKLRIADYVVDNGGRKSATEKIVKKIWREVNQARP